MGQANLEKERAEFMNAAGEMYDELRQWRGDLDLADCANVLGPLCRNPRLVASGREIVGSGGSLVQSGSSDHMGRKPKG